MSKFQQIATKIFIPTKKVPKARKNQKAAPQKEKAKAKSPDKERHKEAVRRGKQITRTVLDIYPVRDYLRTKTGGYFLLQDNTCMDILWIRGKSYFNRSEDEVRGLVASGTQFERKYKEPYKILSLNMPTNTKQHRDYLTYMSERQTSKKHRQMLQELVWQYQRLDETTTERQSFFFVFAASEDQLRTLKGLLYESPIFIEEISYEIKADILWRLNNMSKSIK
ncbi:MULTISPECIES: hypothetical protein [Caproicibacterium]|uniref:Uncharacterized protein n=1 Tax=Caproicibacterium argilliputei TaxID=3030016 RepID=A0AA97DB38_9FIRM|nr:hypothetical protein [Caproicibacterium argilliputei]WOC32363.1 hypothetical protein PXC00_00415 [Caproicibacterium argilliputei]